jgi:hypothetical protein
MGGGGKGVNDHDFLTIWPNLGSMVEMVNPNLTMKILNIKNFHGQNGQSKFHDHFWHFYNSRFFAVEIGKFFEYLTMTTWKILRLCSPHS